MELLKKDSSYTLVKYEEIMNNPKEVISNILSDAGFINKDLSFINKSLINLDIDHTVSGNPMRFKVGEIELKLDDQWKSHMSPKNISIVTMLTYPWLKKYGYI